MNDRCNTQDLNTKTKSSSSLEFTWICNKHLIIGLPSHVYSAIYHKPKDNVPGRTKQTANPGSEQSLRFVLFCFSYLDWFSLNQFNGLVHREEKVNSSSSVTTVHHAASGQQVPSWLKATATTCAERTRTNLNNWGERMSHRAFVFKQF